MPKKESLGGEKKTLNFTYICDFGVVLSLTCVVGLCVDVCVFVCVCVCKCVLLLLLLLLLCGQAQVFFQVPNYKHYFPLFSFLLLFKKRKGGVLSQEESASVSISPVVVLLSLVNPK